MDIWENWTQGIEMSGGYLTLVMASHSATNWKTKQYSNIIFGAHKDKMRSKDQYIYVIGQHPSIRVHTNRINVDNNSVIPTNLRKPLNSIAGHCAKGTNVFLDHTILYSSTAMLSWLLYYF